jgi:class 3 adenylate cyclase
LLDEIQEFLTGSRGVAPADRMLATVLFTDIVDSTKQAAELGDHQWRALLDRHDAIARQLIEQFHGRVIKSTGDGVLATFDGPARAVRAASAMRESLRSLKIRIRSGVHTGEVELRGDDIGGMGVHIAQRVQAEARPSEVAVSRTVVDLVAGSGLSFADRGEHELKGVPGTWRIFAVDS